MPTTFYLYGILILLVILLIYVISIANLNIFIKMLAIALLFLGIIGFSFSFESFKGWPTEDIPSSGRILGISIDEGKWIYFWLNESKEEEHWYSMFEYKQDSPRVYKMVWTKELAEKFSNAKSKLQQEYIVYFHFSKKFGMKGQDSNISSQDVPDLEIVSPNEVNKNE